MSLVKAVTVVRPIHVSFYRCGRLGTGRGWQKCPTSYECGKFGCQRIDPRCTHRVETSVNSDQDDPCRCTLDKNHDGDCQCNHTRPEEDK